MAGGMLWAWDTDNEVWVKVKTDSQGRLYTVADIDELDDIGDVYVPTPTDNYILYWNNANSRWECKANWTAAHKDSHENGGADEISVAGLSGELADDQPPKAHLLGGAKHTADSLANLNALINDATLDDSSASRTPLAHKDSHDPEDGSDPLDTAAPVKVGDANAVGTSHSLARADHVHEKHHAKYTDAEAVTAAKTVKLDDFTAPDDTTDLDASAALHGLMPKADKSKLDGIAAGADVTADNAPQAHKTSHENGGGDEISVAGLSGLLADDQHVLDAEVISAVKADAGLPVATITFIIDGGGSAITTGIKGVLEIPFACTINRVTLLADQSGSIVIDIWKQAYADYPPEDANSITASAPPTLSSALKSQDSTLSGWTTTIAAGDCLMFNVDSVATITWVTLSLKVTKT